MDHRVNFHILIFLSVLPTFLESLSLDVKEGTRTLKLFEEHAKTLVHVFGTDMDHDHVDELEKTRYGKDPEDSKRLFQLEVELAGKLRKMRDLMHAHDGDMCLLYLSKYLDEYDEATEIIKATAEDLRAEIVANNPILAFKLVRRMTATLINDTLWMCKEKEDIIAAVEDAFLDTNLIIPSELNLHEIAHSLIAIQFIYGLNATEQMRFGILSKTGHRVQGTLNFDDCLFLAEEALHHGFLDVAYQWLVGAELSKQKHYLRETNLVKSEKVWNEIKEVLGWKFKESIHKLLRQKRADDTPTLTGKPVLHDGNIFCGEELKLNLPALQFPKDIVCYYNKDRHPYFLLQPLKIEALSEAPFILQFHDFLTNSEINAVREEEDLENVDINDEDEVRNAVLEKNEDPVLVNLLKKIEMMTKLKASMDANTGHIFYKMLQTPLGGFCNVEKLRGKANAFNDKGQKKFATFYMFLNDVTHGGNHAFPKIGTAALPIKGSVLFWYDRRRASKLKDYKLNAKSCPVVVGVKEGAYLPLVLGKEDWPDPVFRYDDLDPV